MEKLQRLELGQTFGSFEIPKAGLYRGRHSRGAVAAGGRFINGQFTFTLRGGEMRTAGGCAHAVCL